MSDARRATPPSPRARWTWLGWIGLGAALVVLYRVGAEVFASALGVALHASPPPARQTTSWRLWLWIATAASATAVVLAGYGRRWVLLVLSVLVTLAALAAAVLATMSEFAG